MNPRWGENGLQLGVVLVKETQLKLKINCKNKVTAVSFIHSFHLTFHWHYSVLPFREVLLKPELIAVNEILSWCHDFLAFIRPSASQLGHLANCLVNQVKKTSKMDKLSVSTMSRFFKMWKRHSSICAASICLTQPWRCRTLLAKYLSLLMRIFKNGSLLIRIIGKNLFLWELLRMILVWWEWLGIILWRSQVTHLGWEGLASPVLRKPAKEVRGKLFLRRGMIWRFDNQVL